VPAPNIIAEPGAPLAAAGFDGIAADFGAAMDDCPKTMVAPPSPSGAAGLGLAVGAVIGLVPGGVVLRFPVWNIIVRPAPSSVGATTGLSGAAGGLVAAGAAGLAMDGAANTIVDDSSFAGAAGPGAAGLGAASCSDERVTLNVFWHFPQRMVRPWGPMRASSTL
jgi:hypothetical protein